MANTPVDPGPQAALTNPLQILSGVSVLFEAPLVKPGSGKFERNRRGYQAFESEEQAASGDGRLVVGERTVDIIVTGDTLIEAHAALYELDAALELATHLRFADTTVELVGSRGITSWQPVLTGSPHLRVTITYLPRFAAGVTSSAASVLGPL